MIYWRWIPDEKLGDFAQSYVFLKPLRELHSGISIPGFITQDRFEEARDRGPSQMGDRDRGTIT